jgi:phosphoribosylanthranilate isomerase
VVIGIYVDIFPAEIAAIAKILELSGVQIHGDSMLLF